MPDYEEIAINNIISQLNEVMHIVLQVKSDVEVIKAEQSNIKTELKEHIESNKEAPKSGLEAAQSICQRYIIPIALGLILLGRYSVSYVGNGPTYTRSVPAQKSEKMVNDDTFIARNEAMDSIIRSTIKKQAGLE